MPKKRYINDNIREDTYIMDLDPSEKLLFIYLLTNNKVSLCGIYEIHIRKIALETGFDRDMIQKILARFEKENKMYYREGYLMIVNFLKNQSLNDNMKKGVEREINSISDETLGLFMELEGFERLSKALESFGILNLTLLNSTLPNFTGHNVPQKSEQSSPEQEKEKEIKLTRVHITEEEYQKLLDRFYKKDVDNKIEYMDNYCVANNKRYDSYYRALLNWLKRDCEEKKDDSLEAARKRNEQKRKAFLADQS